VTLCQAEEVGNNKNAFLHHELNPSCSALIRHSLTQQFQLVCVQTSAMLESRSHQRKAVTIHQLAGPVMKCNFCGHKYQTFFQNGSYQTSSKEREFYVFIKYNNCAVHQYCEKDNYYLNALHS